MMRIVIEEECEHGDVTPHYIFETVGFGREVGAVTRPTSECPGGSRRVVELDYEAAERVLLPHVWRDEWDSIINSREASNLVRAIVDAAFSQTPTGEPQQGDENA